MRTHFGGPGSRQKSRRRDIVRSLNRVTDDIGCYNSWSERLCWDQIAAVIRSIAIRGFFCTLLETGMSIHISLIAEIQVI